MGWPQIAMIVLYAGGLGVAAAKHGEPQPDYSFWTTLIATIINVVLLTCGGFWH